MHILIVEDDPDVRDTLISELEAGGFTPDARETGEEGLEAALAGPYDVILLDVGLPGMTGFQVVETLRERRNTTPVIMLTAYGAEDDVIRGLDAGADGYMTKPYSARELQARIRAVQRRSSIGDAIQLTFGDLIVDQGEQTVKRGDRPVRLTGTEFKLLATLMKAGGEPLSKPELLSRIWGIDFDPQTPMLEVHVANLRKKLNAAGPPIVATIRGQGYCLKEDLEA